MLVGIEEFRSPVAGQALSERSGIPGKRHAFRICDSQHERGAEFFLAFGDESAAILFVGNLRAKRSGFAISVLWDGAPPGMGNPGDVNSH